MRTPDYLEAAKKKLGITSDYALAARLGMTRSSISQYQSGKNQMSDDVAIKIADILEVDRSRVLLDCAIERSKSPEIVAVWTNVMKTLSHSFDSLIAYVAPRPTAY